MTRDDLHRAITEALDGLVPAEHLPGAVSRVSDVATAWCAAQMAMAVTPPSGPFDPVPPEPADPELPRPPSRDWRYPFGRPES